jgi:hypothetical protein
MPELFVLRANDALQFILFSVLLGRGAPQALFRKHFPIGKIILLILSLPRKVVPAGLSLLLKGKFLCNLAVAVDGGKAIAGVWTLGVLLMVTPLGNCHSLEGHDVVEAIVFLVFWER